MEEELLRLYKEYLNECDYEIKIDLRKEIIRLSIKYDISLEKLSIRLD